MSQCLTQRPGLNILRKLPVNHVHAESRCECTDGMNISRWVRIEANLKNVANRVHVPNNGARMASTSRRRILNLRLVSRSKLLGGKAARLSRMRNEFRKCSVTCGVVIHLQDIEIEAIRAPVHELFGGGVDD